MKLNILWIILIAGSADCRQSCYKCVSHHLSANWGRYMPLLAESERTPDSYCDDAPQKSPHSECDGPCMSINVTGQYKGKPAFFGTLRDCYSHYHRAKKVLESDRECSVRTVTIKGKDYTAEYCYCNASYCNGEPQTLSASASSFTNRRSYSRRYRNSGSLDSISIGGLILTMLAFF